LKLNLSLFLVIFLVKRNYLFGLSCATVGIIIMFRNYITTFFTTKNPVFMNNGFNSVMNFI